MNNYIVCCHRPCLSSLHRDLWRQSPSIRRSHHRHFSSPSSFYPSLAQAATPRAAPLSVSHLLCVPTSESEASGLCLLQSVFVHEAPTAIVASPRTHRHRHDLPFAFSLLHHPSFSISRCRTRTCSPHR